MSLDIAYLDMYKQLGTEEDEKKRKKENGKNITRMEHRI
jgi:hypothetical protein